MRRHIALPCVIATLLVPLFVPHLRAQGGDRAFYVPENPAYTILDSARDSVRFTLEKTVRRDRHGHLVSISSFVDPAGQVMGWHDFGNLEGPGWACNAVGGAYDQCLAGLGQFKMHEDRNGVATKGLLYMEKSWDTAYLWENAEAALAHFEAAADCRASDPAKSRDFELTGLVILRAIAKHHYGEHGFLTEGVDWNDHVGQQHHIGQAKYAAIRYTEPFLNNQHIVEPTVFYLKHLAKVTVGERGPIRWWDAEGNAIMTRSTPP